MPPLLAPSIGTSPGTRLGLLRTALTICGVCWFGIGTITVAALAMGAILVALLVGTALQFGFGITEPAPNMSSHIREKLTILALLGIAGAFTWGLGLLDLGIADSHDGRFRSRDQEVVSLLLLSNSLVVLTVLIGAFFTWVAITNSHFLWAFFTLLQR